MPGGRPQVLWEGLAELRADAPSKARGAEGEQGRPPPSSNTQCPITPRTRQARPTKKVTFPRNKAEKSPYQQHDLSILIVGPNQLKHQLSRTRKPKSRHKTNTFCPLTQIGTATPPPQPEENKNRRSRRICGFIVREGGVEPPLHHWNTDLNRARLPIPPLARTQKE